MLPRMPSMPPLWALGTLWHLGHTPSHGNSYEDEKSGEFVGVGSCCSSGVVSVEETKGGVDDDAFGDQRRSVALSDFGVSCELALDHDGMSTERTCGLKQSAHDVGSCYIYSHMKFILLW